MKSATRMTSSRHVFERLHEGRLKSKVRVCRELLNQLNPDRPPRNCQPKEFLWQYRALRERVAVYEQLMNGAQEPVGARSTALQRAELALNNSLHYFKETLAPATAQNEDDE